MTTIINKNFPNLLRSLYTREVASTAAAGALAIVTGPLSLPLFYIWQKGRIKKAALYLQAGIDTAARKISELSGQISNSEMVNYWKDVIRHLPDYNHLVKAKKFKEIQNILKTLMDHNDIFRNQEARIRDLEQAIKDLQHETQES